MTAIARRSARSRAERTSAVSTLKDHGAPLKQASTLERPTQFGHDLAGCNVGAAQIEQAVIAVFARIILKLTASTEHQIQLALRAKLVAIAQLSRKVTKRKPD